MFSQRFLLATGDLSVSPNLRFRSSMPRKSADLLKPLENRCVCLQIQLLPSVALRRFVTSIYRFRLPFPRILGRFWGGRHLDSDIGSIIESPQIAPTFGVGDRSSFRTQLVVFHGSHRPELAPPVRELTRRRLTFAYHERI